MRPRHWIKAARLPALTIFLAGSALAALPPGSIDSTFNAGRGPLQISPGAGYGAVLQSDGKIVAGGMFNGIGLARSGAVVRFNPDGSVDTTFDSSGVEIENGYYTKPLSLQADGKIIVGGSFDTADGAHHSLLRLNTNGTLDSAFNPILEWADPGAAPIVNRAIVQPDGKLLISGVFATVNGVARPSLARLNADGTLDTTFVPVAGGGPIALQEDGKILATTGGHEPRAVRLESDGSIDPSFDSDLTKVGALLLRSDGKIIVSQDVFFNEIFETVRLESDGSIDPSFLRQPGFAIALDASDRTYLCVNGNVMGFQRLNPDGTTDSTFQPSVEPGYCASTVVEQPDQKLIVVGGSSGVARLLENGQIDPSFDVEPGLTIITDGSIEHAQLLPDGGIIVSGAFTHIDTLPRNKLARLNHDGTLDPDFDAGDLAFDNPGVLAVQDDGKIVVGIHSDIFRLLKTGEIDPSFSYTVPNFAGVQAIALQPDGKLLVGEGEAFVRLNPDGSSDSSFDPGLDAGRGVSQILLQPDGKILINGNFSSIHGIPGIGPVRLESDGALDESFDFSNGHFNSLVALQPDGKVLITNFGLFTFLTRVNPDGSVDQGFDSMFAAVHAAVERDGVYLGTNTVARLHSDGSVDSRFAPVFAADAAISQLLLQVDGQIIAAGNFSQVNGVAVNGIVRLNGVAPEKVANISTRASVGTGDAVEIGGFIVTGAAEKSVIIRAIGPSLQVDGAPLPGVISNPRLELRDSAGQLIVENDNWRDSQETEIIASGLAPSNEQESAIAVTLAPGAYTAVVQGSGGETGIALVEVYDALPASDSRLQNISTRGSVQIGDDVLIAGLILSGPESAPVVLRALGPSLSAFEIAAPLGDPTIELHDQSGAIIAANDDWKETQETELTDAGLAPTNDKEAALLATLAPGPYTAIVRGGDGATGVGLVEFYDLR
ncbi:MAG: delta-60 repeat domain-containing protein [Verrucomicrobiota bacterium]|nr:delta-60 repeat domain-containing protein [Chthoniobacterales bacterium]MDQ3413728.1 delta-60 repeat domain-containing protein [Verrucomicrobiota bacterium]